MLSIPRSNRTVFAEVTYSGNESEMVTARVEDAFQKCGWELQREDENYLLLIPLYCARVVALEKAQNVLARFSERYFPLTINELRLADQEARDIRMFYVTRQEDKDKKSELPLNQLHWQIYIENTFSEMPPPTAAHEDDKETAEKSGESSADSRLEARAREKAADSSLPGSVFDSARMQVTQAAGFSADSRLARLARKNPIKWSLLVVFIIGTLTTSATFVWFKAWNLFITAGLGLITAFLAGLAGWKAIENRKTYAPRVLAAIIAIFLVYLLGGATARIVETMGRTQVAPMFLGIASVLLVFTFIVGWYHMLIVRPQMRKMLSIRVISTIAAGALTVSPILLTVFGNEDQGTNTWLNLLVTMLILVSVASIYLLLGGLVGWLDYFGMFQGTIHMDILPYIYVVVAVLGWTALTVSTFLSFISSL